MSELEAKKQARILVLNLLQSKNPTPEELREAIEDVLPVVERRHEVILDTDQLLRELEAELNVFQPEAASLDDNHGHLEWLPGRRDSIDWRFWNRYVRYLQEEERLPPLAGC
jgi:hypothetical protein